MLTTTALRARDLTGLESYIVGGGLGPRTGAPKGWLLLSLAGLFFLVSGASTMAAYSPVSVTPASPPREFRGAWVASVANIDWPSTNTLTSDQQQAELITLLDQAVAVGLNAVIFQVRPACDALYPSKIEPWSEYLTGQMGVAPKPFYDPLELAVKEAHKRGLELHAWFNPYRALHPSAKSPVAARHISKRRPDLVRQYGKQVWLDPGEREVQDYTLSVVMEVVKNYDVDGIHFDDYFYPYKEPGPGGKDLEFPDDRSWQKFGVASKLTREDWRRDNVNRLVERTFRSVKAAKPYVKFGVSPFGIWRPGNPPQVRGFDAYDKLYADARAWMVRGWVDYLAPQLYWSIDSPGQSFPVLLKWWEEQNTARVQLWPGLNSYNVGRTWKPEEIVNQIHIARKESGVTGHIHWDMRKGLMAGTGLSGALKRELYSQAALVPKVNGAGPALGKPSLNLSEKGSSLQAQLTSPDTRKVKLWVVQSRSKGQWTYRILPGIQRSCTWNSSKPDIVAAAAVDRWGQLGSWTAMQRQ